MRIIQHIIITLIGCLGKLSNAHNSTLLLLSINHSLYYTSYFYHKSVVIISSEFGLLGPVPLFASRSSFIFPVAFPHLLDVLHGLSLLVFQDALP